MFGFRSVWCCDFEYGIGPTGRPIVHCMAAKEIHCNTELRLWRSDLLLLHKAPFDTGSNSLFVAYSAGAEISCFIELGWPISLNILDIYAEYLALTNGHRDKKAGTGLLHAMEHYGLGHLALAEKAAMRELAIRGGPWTAQEIADLLNYCGEDVDSLCRLLPVMEPELASRPAFEWLFRGRYIAAVQVIEQNGVPLDAALLEEIKGKRLGIIKQLADRLEAQHHFGIYDGTHFTYAGFNAWVRQHGLRWPRTATGMAAVDDATLRRMAETRLDLPLRPLYECKRSIGMLSKFEITVDPDGRSRCWLAPLRSETGRNLPSNSKFVFGAPSWMRVLIKPAEEYGVAYLDWSAQEIAIAAGLSGDERMINHYASGDVYIRLAESIGLVPAGASKATHPKQRDLCKVIFLATNYGQSAYGLAQALGCSKDEARDLLRRFSETYRTFNAYKQSLLNGSIHPVTHRTPLGWPWWTGRCKNRRTVMNHPAQSAGSDMMRLAAIAAIEAGIEVCAPVHDAFLIAAPLQHLDHDIEHMLAIMQHAGARVASIPVRAECASIVRYPDRFVPERGLETWNLVQQAMRNIGKEHGELEDQCGRLHRAGGRGDHDPDRTEASSRKRTQASETSGTVLSGAEALADQPGNG